MSSFRTLGQVALIGFGATVVMDAWLLACARLGVPMADFALVGRWIGHMPRGRFVHAAISAAEPIEFERALGWLTHYAVGLAYASMLVGLQGTAWLAEPTFLPALAFGMATVVVPWFVMQPAMGAGFASTKTPTPLKNGLRSLANHAVFGAGLYLAAVAAAWATG